MEDTKEAMAFTNELMYNLSRREHIEYSSSFPGVEAMTESIVTHFQDDVWIAVQSLITAKEEEISKCHDDLLEHPVLVLDEIFAQLAIEAAPFYFPKGYTPDNFLEYCAMVMGVGLQFVKYGRDPVVLEYASIAVSTVLIGFLLSNEFQQVGGYEQLIVTCVLFNHAYNKLKLEKKMKKKKKNKKKK